MLFAIFAFVFIFCTWLPVSPLAKTVCAIVGLILLVIFTLTPGAYGGGAPLMAPPSTHFNWKL